MEPAAETGARARPFASGREHLEVALGLLQVRLRRAVLERRRRPEPYRFHDLSGLVITEEEIDRLRPPWPSSVAETPGAQTPGDENPETAAEEERLDRLERRLALRLEEGVAGALAAGVRLPMAELATLFDLAPFDLDALLVCLAPELDLRFETLYAYLHDDVTRKRP
ncbi:MAG: hypothetical protein PVG07_15775 [Acidobacteriota bacterium]|jgi:hypothetical protein